MPERILIVDDDRDMCEVIAAKLRKNDLEPCWFTSVADALGAFRNGLFDVVVTDLRVPGIDGLEFCRMIAETRSDVPVVVITALGSLESAISAIRAGAFDFVTKPIEMDLLALAVERAFDVRLVAATNRDLETDIEAGRYNYLSQAGAYLRKQVCNRGSLFLIKKSS